jgi:hypothetical protein
MFVIWPSSWFGYALACVCILGLAIYPSIYVRKTRVVVEDGWLRVFDLAWRDQAIAVDNVAGIRRKGGGYWEVYSHIGEVVRIRPVWKRATMNELAKVLDVPIKGPIDDWSYHTDLNLDARIAFTRWLRTRRKLAEALDQTRTATPSESAIEQILHLRHTENQRWQAFLDARVAGGGQ